MRYEIEDIINEKSDAILVKRYRDYISGLPKPKLAEMFEQLLVLSSEQLAIMKLVYHPRSSNCYSSFYIITNHSGYSTYIVFKNDDYNPPRYCV